MDRFIAGFAAADADLVVSCAHGVAYQRDMGARRIAYDEHYLEHYRALEGSVIQAALNDGRIGLLARHAPAGARVLDVGVGNGSFVRAARLAGFDVRGFDVNPAAVAMLRADGLYADDPAPFDAVTLWDSLEHMEDPGELLARIRPGTRVFAAIPVIEDLARVRESKHYKPGEHLYYFTAAGFTAWMALWGLRLLEKSDHEVQAGRSAIGAYAFSCELPCALRPRRACACGGAVRLDDFDPVRRPVEYFMRCEACGAMSPPASSAAEAERQWSAAEKKEQLPCEQGACATA